MAGGWLGGLSGSAELVMTPPPSRNISKSRAGHSARISGKKDFASLVQRMQLTGGIPAAGFSSLGRASTTELQQLLCNLTERGGVREDWIAMRHKFKLLAAIAHELYIRQGVESLNWAESTESPMVNQLLLAELGSQDPVMLKSRLMENYLKYGIPNNFGLNQGMAISESPDYGETMRGVSRFSIGPAWVDRIMVRFSLGLDLLDCKNFAQFAGDFAGGFGDGDFFTCFVGEAAHGDAGYAAGGDGEEGRQAFAGDVDGEAVHGNPFADADADGGEFAVFHPDAGEAVAAAGIDAEAAAGENQGVFNFSEVLVEVAAAGG